ncbi:unnamed protein product [Chironomus riparius]|uniref:Ionotropic receptor n=1 Tax=Chironomus riparius TaxID=315576 RepID=A0A9N9WRN3_9DIPT|nr:unnamed protein product [Chironomus riparius]
MELKNLLVKFLIISLISAVPQAQLTNAILNVVDNSIKWDKLTSRLGQMMMHSDVAAKKKAINVLIFSMVDQQGSLEFNGMLQSLAKHQPEAFSYSLKEFKVSKVEVRFEFSILLMDSSILNYDSFIRQNFILIFPDLSTKFFVIMTRSLDIRKVFNVWNVLSRNGYYNVYIVLHSNTVFKMFRTYLEDDHFQMIETNDTKFLTVKEMSEDSWMLHINIIYYNSYPMSYIENGDIIGSDGKLMHEFSKRVKIPFRIINRNMEKLLLNEIIQYLTTVADICLYANLNLKGDNVYNVWLNEMDGLCVLTPRNIPISSYDNLALPLDSMSLVMSFVSTVSVIVSWKLISIYTANGRSLQSIIVAILEIIFNTGASGIEQITKKEVILLYSFIFSSIILDSFYESLLLAFMLAEQTWRSAYDLTELNDSDTKFFKFYSKKAAEFGKVPSIREDLILNFVDIRSMTSLMIPKSFDENLVYLVSCKYADSFIKSTRNFNENRRIFDIIRITKMFQGYPVRKGFPFQDEFKTLVRTWSESGINKFWQKQSLERSMKYNKHKSNNKDEYFDMQFPLILLFTGCTVAFLAFIYENITSRCNSISMKRGRKGEDRLNIQKPRKVKLTKWMNKFIYKDTFDSTQFNHINHKREAMKCRELISGGYFVIRKIRKRKQYRQIIQVRPHLKTNRCN